MNKQTFKQLTGESPEDVLGNDWANEIEELKERETKTYLLYLKSHCEAPDFEKEYLAVNKEEAVAQATNELDLDYKTVYDNMEIV